MTKIVPELIYVTSIRVYKANVDTSKEYLDNPTSVEQIGVEYAQDSAFSFEKNAVRIRIDIKLEGKDSDDKELGVKADYGLEFHFIVENLNEFVEEKDGEKLVNGQLGATLLGIAFSTARGIVLERTQATYFDGVILPVIDPKGMIK